MLAVVAGVGPSRKECHEQDHDFIFVHGRSDQLGEDGGTGRKWEEKGGGCRWTAVIEYSDVMNLMDVDRRRPDGG